MSSQGKIELDENEKEFLTLLIKLRKKLRGEDWKESLKTGIRIPEKGFSHKFETRIDEDVEDFNQEIESLEEKGIIGVKEVKTEKDHAKWNIDYNSDEEGSTSLEKEKQIRGTEEKRYLSIEEEKLDKLTSQLNFN